MKYWRGLCVCLAAAVPAPSASTTTSTANPAIFLRIWEPPPPTLTGRILRPRSSVRAHTRSGGVTDALAQSSGVVVAGERNDRQPAGRQRRRARLVLLRPEPLEPTADPV